MVCKSMSKKLIMKVNMMLPAGKITPQNVGAVLGPKGVNIMEFCKSFNAATQEVELGRPVRVSMDVFEDKTFTFVVKSSPTSYYLKKLVKVEKGSSNTKKEASIGKIKLSSCMEIVKVKMSELNTIDFSAALNTIKGTALSMGIEVEDDL